MSCRVADPRPPRTASSPRSPTASAVDVLVVGGGITGAGVALDAATPRAVGRAGRARATSRTARAAGAPSSSTAACATSPTASGAWPGSPRASARLLMRHVAPHLVRPLPFVIPLAAGIEPRRRAMTARPGCAIGDGLRAGARTQPPRAAAARAASARRGARASRPALRRRRAARRRCCRWDGQLEDDARLVVAVARTAAAHGARVLTRVRGDGASTRRRRRRGRRADRRGASTIRARRVVNATGVWAGELAAAVALRPSRGTHLLVAAERLGDPRAAVNVPVPGERGRWVFALPRTDGLVCDRAHRRARSTAPIPDVPRADAGGGGRVPARDASAPRSTSRSTPRRRRRPLRRAAPAARPATARRTADLSRRHAVRRGPGTAW